MGFAARWSVTTARDVSVRERWRGSGGSADCCPGTSPGGERVPTSCPINRYCFERSPRSGRRCHNRRTMKFVINALRASAAVVFCTLVVGCSLFKERTQGPPLPPPPPSTPMEAAPTQTQRFELTPDQDAVGVVQLTTTTKEDTLTDIARRF